MFLPSMSKKILSFYNEISMPFHPLDYSFSCSIGLTLCVLADGEWVSFFLFKPIIICIAVADLILHHRIKSV